MRTTKSAALNITRIGQAQREATRAGNRWAMYRGRDPAELRRLEDEYRSARQRLRLLQEDEGASMEYRLALYA